MSLRRDKNKNMPRVFDISSSFTTVFNRQLRPENHLEEAKKSYTKVEGDILSGKKVDMGLKLMKSVRTCDGLVLIGRDRAAVKVHRAILAGNSPFFDRLFFPKEKGKEAGRNDSKISFCIAGEKLMEEMGEAANKEVKDEGKEEVKEKVKSSLVEELKNGEIDVGIQVCDDMMLTKVEVSEFNVFVEYCYTGRLSLPSFEVGMRIYKLADKFQIPALGLDATAAILEFITVDNALQIFFTASDECYSVIKKFVESFIIENADKIFTKRNVFKDFSIPDIAQLLNLKLKVGEDTILARVLEYADSSLGVGMGKSERRKAMRVVLRLVNVRKIGAEGMRLASSSGLFKKSKLLEAVLANREADKLLLPLLH
eukprot:TRINITY_DN1309_c0_g1_i2.p1 TRINITY_DN1309_c0_g1~~TRINITY_DN1309_c0_g1_i2.p1  ORF type:complete len:369 (-),score=106.11 TRINITY_DN1309_c0_g1_i2:147-1253(-)